MRTSLAFKVRHSIDPRRIPGVRFVVSVECRWRRGGVIARSDYELCHYPLQAKRPRTRFSTHAPTLIPGRHENKGRKNMAVQYVRRALVRRTYSPRHPFPPCHRPRRSARLRSPAARSPPSRTCETINKTGFNFCFILDSRRVLHPAPDAMFENRGGRCCDVHV